MVLVSYEDVEESYEEIKQAACGRQACSVLIMVAYEVQFLFMLWCSDHLNIRLTLWLPAEYLLSCFVVTMWRTLFVLSLILLNWKRLSIVSLLISSRLSYSTVEGYDEFIDVSLLNCL